MENVEITGHLSVRRLVVSMLIWPSPTPDRCRLFLLNFIPLLSMCTRCTRKLQVILAIE